MIGHGWQRPTCIAAMRGACHKFTPKRGGEARPNQGVKMKAPRRSHLKRLSFRLFYAPRLRQATRGARPEKHEVTN